MLSVREFAKLPFLVYTVLHIVDDKYHTLFSGTIGKLLMMNDDKLLSRSVVRIDNTGGTLTLSTVQKK